MMDINGFIFGGMDSADCGIILREPPPILVPERDQETVSIPGRSGDVVLDNGRYKNVRIPYTCAILPEEYQTLREAADAATAQLCRVRSYARLENTYEPDHFRLARIYGEISAEEYRGADGTVHPEF